MATPDLEGLAARHRVSVDAVEELAAALRASGGSLAQFSHPELGGRGQWMPGMIQIGDMFNDALKAKVAALCTDLASMLRADPPTDPSAFRKRSMPPMRPMEPMKPMRPMQPIPAWWPAGYGEPDAAGGQDDVRYAWFAAKRRLLVDIAGYVAAYDTRDHTITGIAQSQGGTSHLRFTSQHGPISLDDLQAVEL